MWPAVRTPSTPAGWIHTHIMPLAPSLWVASVSLSSKRRRQMLLCGHLAFVPDSSGACPSGRKCLRCSLTSPWLEPTPNSLYLPCQTRFSLRLDLIASVIQPCSPISSLHIVLTPSLVLIMLCHHVLIWPPFPQLTPSLQQVSGRTHL